MTRHITQRQEQIYRLRHHDFAGLTTKQVAAVLRVQPRVIRKHMQRLKQIAPQLFPILTERQTEVLALWFVMSPKETGLYLGVETMTVYSTLRDLRNKAMYMPGKKGCVLRYSEWMDFQVKQKF